LGVEQSDSEKVQATGKGLGWNVAVEWKGKEIKKALSKRKGLLSTRLCRAI
jgi:hypothetical protein